MMDLTSLEEDPNFQRFLQMHPAVIYLTETQVVDLFKNWIHQQTFETIQSVTVPQKILDLMIQQMNLIHLLNSRLAQVPSFSTSDLEEIPDEEDTDPIYLDPFIVQPDDDSFLPGETETLTQENE